ncbi:hypothetical protein A5765_14305 [Mycolicibacterium celeriflavum]|uniref:hypothetical protein n=1 Tax=Mycolicibacterium celeriflavum TaxID=1249101 RepID=UPI0007FDDD41|nr:hypothetical protein [Mycolicibacterium celeriflavum]OBG12526.1 hypothetical protein A5765_14305 [Mycolicibacterium celeriflavum]
MANELQVDTVGLRIAAANSEVAGAGLTNAGLSGPTSPQPSGAGVAAVNAALSAVRQRQSNRITGQAGDLTAGSARYDSTDTEGADAITTVSV